MGDADLAVVAAQLGRFLALESRPAEATPMLEEALELAEHLGLPKVYSQALGSRAVSPTRSDRPDEAGLLLRRALEVAMEHGHTAAAWRAFNNLGVVLEAQDRFAELAVLADRAIEYARRVGDRIAELNALAGALAGLIALGRWDEALTRAEEVQGAEELATLEFVSAALVGLVPIHVRRGDLGKARALLDSLSWTRTSEDWQVRMAHAIAASEFLRASHRPAEALKAAEEVLEQRKQLGIGFTNGGVKLGLVQGVEAALDLGDHARAEELMAILGGALPGQVSPWLRAQLARLSARRLAAAGQHETVESAFDAAEAGFRALDTAFDLAVALAEHAEWLVGQGRPDRAGPLRDQAREIFARLRVRPWLERVGPISEPQTVPA